MFRSGLVLVSAVLALTASGCSRDKAMQNRAEWGCSDIVGADALKGKDAPRWVLVGEATESREGPLAVAELACHLASDGQTVWVGRAAFYPTTDAEDLMLARLRDLAGKGAPIVTGEFPPPLADGGRKTRSEAEAKRAETVRGHVAAAGSKRALLFTTAADAATGPFAPSGERFAGYEPLAMHLGEGGVASLLVHRSADAGLPAPTVTLHLQAGRDAEGELSLARLTRPKVQEVATVLKESGRSARHFPQKERPIDALLRQLMTYELTNREDVDRALRALFRPDLSREDFRGLYVNAVVRLHIQRLAFDEVLAALHANNAPKAEIDARAAELVRDLEHPKTMLRSADRMYDELMGESDLARAAPPEARSIHRPFDTDPVLDPPFEIEPVIVLPEFSVDP
jgi:hypothetical protein